MTTHRITIGSQFNRKHFDTQVKAVKQAGAQYDPATKTWTLELDADESPLEYGLGTCVTFYGMTIVAE
jgi:hypothetical protein